MFPDCHTSTSIPQKPSFIAASTFEGLFFWCATHSPSPFFAIDPEDDELLVPPLGPTTIVSGFLFCSFCSAFLSSICFFTIAIFCSRFFLVVSSVT